MRFLLAAASASAYDLGSESDKKGNDKRVLPRFYDCVDFIDSGKESEDTARFSEHLTSGTAINHWILVKMHPWATPKDVPEPLFILAFRGTDSHLGIEQDKALVFGQELIVNALREAVAIWATVATEIELYGDYPLKETVEDLLEITAPDHASTAGMNFQERWMKLVNALDLLVKALKDHQPAPVNNFFITGHSLGGYVAQVLSSVTNLPAAGFNAPGVKLNTAQWTGKLLNLLGAKNHTGPYGPWTGEGDTIVERHSMAGDPVSGVGGDEGMAHLPSRLPDAGLDAPIEEGEYAGMTRGEAADYVYEQDSDVIMAMPAVPDHEIAENSQVAQALNLLEVSAPQRGIYEKAVTDQGIIFKHGILTMIIRMLFDGTAGNGLDNSESSNVPLSPWPPPP